MLNTEQLILNTAYRILKLNTRYYNGYYVMLYGLLTAPASLPSEQVFFRVLKIREGYYGTKHRLTLMTLNYLACVFRDQQRFDLVGVTVGWGGHEGKR